MIEAERRIREALAAGPTPGPWKSELLDQNDFADVHRVFGTDTSHEATLCELWSGEHNNEAAATYIAACNPTNIAALLAEIDRLTRERDEARAERDALRDVLLRHGFVPCDIPACNCGSWHARFGYPERMREIADVLGEAGHELSNENGNMPLNALRELIAERDALAKQGEAFRHLVDACKLLASEAEEYEFDDGMGRGALLDYWYEFDRKLDAAIDAQIEKERSE